MNNYNLDKQLLILLYKYGYRYLARDSDGMLTAHIASPNMDIIMNYWTSDGNNCIYLPPIIDNFKKLLRNSSFITIDSAFEAYDIKDDDLI